MTVCDSITKLCGDCKEVKWKLEFAKDKLRKDGLYPYCKICNQRRQKKNYEKNKEKYKTRMREHYSENKEAYIKKASSWAKNNKEKRKEITKKYVVSNPEARKQSQRNDRLNNPGLYAAHYKMRQTRKKRAMPVWACEESVKAIYRQCAFVNRMTGIKHHVDHYYPLTSDIVCGLHNEFNLRIIPAVENLSKGNKLPTGGHHEC